MNLKIKLYNTKYCNGCPALKISRTGNHNFDYPYCKLSYIKNNKIFDTKDFALDYKFNVSWHVSHDNIELYHIDVIRPKKCIKENGK